MTDGYDLSSRRMNHLRRLEDRLLADVVSAAFDGGASDQIHVPSRRGSARLRAIFDVTVSGVLIGCGRSR